MPDPKETETSLDKHLKEEVSKDNTESFFVSAKKNINKNSKSRLVEYETNTKESRVRFVGNPMAQTKKYSGVKERSFEKYNSNREAKRTHFEGEVLKVAFASRSRDWLIFN